jgi:hypothetical protein
MVEELVWSEEQAPHRILQASSHPLPCATGSFPVMTLLLLRKIQTLSDA